MDIADFDPALRRALDIEDGTDVRKHAEILAAVNVTHPHGISLLEPLDEYSTCGMYALGFTGDPLYTKIAKSHQHIFAGRQFFAWLVSGKLVSIDEPGEDSLALYFDHGTWKHVAIVENGVARSKWGKFPVYRHPLPEIPSTYGDSISFYTRPSREDALAWFVEFARSQGVPEASLSLND